MTGKYITVLVAVAAILTGCLGTEDVEVKPLKIVDDFGTVVSLDAITVISSGPYPNSGDPVHYLKFVLTESAGIKLSELSKANVGKKISIMLGDERISNPRVAEPISGTVFTMMITSEQQAKEILAAARRQPE